MICAPASQLERAQHRFELWRKTRKRCSRIPESLWDSAVELAREHGVHRTSRALRLDYYSLKKRLSSVGGAPRRPQTEATFVELLPPGATVHSTCTIEMENAQGGKMKIQLQGLGTTDLSILSSSFWKAAS
jgi:hypothetical protein